MNNPIPNEWFKLGPFTIFDIETTGMSPVYHRIVELAAVRIDRDGGQTRFSSLINPCCEISRKLISIHGISNEMVKDASKFKDVGYNFMDFCKGSTLVAHNARFDLSFLQESLARTGLKTWNGKTLDTIPLIKQAYPGLHSYSLQNLRTTFGLSSEVGPAHRAFADVEWTLEIFKLTMKRLLGAYI
ncbi:MAG: 3'-5' exonuclease [bacterium]|nr:3'-5' exonuclease [bacterium]